MVNECVFVGNVTAKPEIKTTKEGGTKYAKFSIACNERGYTKNDGTQVPDRVEYIPVVVWGPRAEICEKYIDKGQQLYVRGKLTIQKDVKDGENRYYPSVRVEDMHMLGRRREQAPEPIPPAGITSEPTAPVKPVAQAEPASMLYNKPLDGDLPF